MRYRTLPLVRYLSIIFRKLLRTCQYTNWKYIDQMCLIYFNNILERYTIDILIII